MDKLENFIKSNKPAFGEHKANTDKLWNQISLELDKEKSKVVPLWKSSSFKIAASIILILGVFSIINLSIGFNSDTSNNLANNELQEIDMYYQNMVQAQVRLVEKNTNLSKRNKQEFLNFLNDLDKEYDLLKLDLSENLDNEMVLEAIIKNYKKRIELIENLLQQINNAKTSTNEDTYIL